jgi:hypothetical protein
MLKTVSLTKLAASIVLPPVPNSIKFLPHLRNALNKSDSDFVKAACIKRLLFCKRWQFAALPLDCKALALMNPLIFVGAGYSLDSA